MNGTPELPGGFGRRVAFEHLETLAQIDTFIAAHPMVLLYITSPGCGVCTALMPRIASMLKRFPEVRAVHLDTALLPAAAGRFEVYTVPAVLLFVRGRETVREARYFSLHELEAKIERYRSLLAP